MNGEFERSPMSARIATRVHGRLQIHSAGNGGWVVSSEPDDMYRSTTLAAVSNDADLLNWLADWLKERSEEEIPE